MIHVSLMESLSTQKTAIWVSQQQSDYIELHQHTSGPPRKLSTTAAAAALEFNSSSNTTPSPPLPRQPIKISSGAKVLRKPRALPPLNPNSFQNSTHGNESPSLNSILSQNSLSDEWHTTARSNHQNPPSSDTPPPPLPAKVYDKKHKTSRLVERGIQCSVEEEISRNVIGQSRGLSTTISSTVTNKHHKVCHTITMPTAPVQQIIVTPLNHVQRFVFNDLRVKLIEPCISSSSNTAAFMRINNQLSSITQRSSSASSPITASSPTTTTLIELESITNNTTGYRQHVQQNLDSLAGPTQLASTTTATTTQSRVCSNEYVSDPVTPCKKSFNRRYVALKKRLDTNNLTVGLQKLPSCRGFNVKKRGSKLSSSLSSGFICNKCNKCRCKQCRPGSRENNSHSSSNNNKKSDNLHNSSLDNSSNNNINNNTININDDNNNTNTNSNIVNCSRTTNDYFNNNTKLKIENIVDDKKDNNNNDNNIIDIADVNIEKQQRHDTQQTVAKEVEVLLDNGKVYTSQCLRDLSDIDDDSVDDCVNRKKLNDRSSSTCCCCGGNMLTALLSCFSTFCCCRFRCCKKLTTKRQQQRHNCCNSCFGCLRRTDGCQCDDDDDDGGGGGNGGGGGVSDGGVADFDVRDDGDDGRDVVEDDDDDVFHSLTS